VSSKIDVRYLFATSLCEIAVISSLVLGSPLLNRRQHRCWIAVEAWPLNGVQLAASTICRVSAGAHAHSLSPIERSVQNEHLSVLIVVCYARGRVLDNRLGKLPHLLLFCFLFLARPVEHDTATPRVETHLRAHQTAFVKDCGVRARRLLDKIEPDWMLLGLATLGNILTLERDLYDLVFG